MNSTIIKLRPLILIAFFIMLITVLSRNNMAKGQAEIDLVEQERVDRLTVENYENKLFELEEHAHFLEYHLKENSLSAYGEELQKISHLLELIDRQIDDYYFSENGGEEKVLVDLGFNLKELENSLTKLEEKLILENLL